MTIRSVIAGGILAVVVTLSGACQVVRIPGPTPEPAPAPDPAEVESVVFLVGDAGEARHLTSPILPKLRQDIEWWAERLEADSAVTVLFLGDIVYPLGLNAPGTELYPADSAVVMDQVMLLAGAHARARGARGYFVAGNHDWGLEKEWEGFVRLLTLRDFLELARNHTGAEVSLVPEAGTGGPYVLDIGSHARLLLLDTAWWLLHGEAQGGMLHLGVLKGVEEAMLTAGEREVFIAAHHPFKSGGPHGGEFSFWRTFGIRYLLARSGAVLQDVSSIPYRELDEGLRDIFGRLGPPLAFIGGHEHSLQVIYGIEPTDPTYNIVSGSASKLSSLGVAHGTQFGRSAPGYMRLVIMKNGGMRLYVEASPVEFQSCPAEEPAREECMSAGVAAFETIHSQRLK